MRKNIIGFMYFSIFLLVFSIHLFSEKSYIAKCIAVEDGDTFTVLYESIPIKIRILGIDAPEGSQDFGDMAASNLKYLIANKILLINDKYKDRFGRTVAEVFLDDKDVGLQMIKSGMAWHFKKYSSDLTYSNAEIDAKKNGIGLWGLPNPIPPWAYRNGGKQDLSTNVSIKSSLVSNLVSEQASEPNIVYITKSGTKYHRSGCSSLRKSKILKSLSEAISAGYSPCGLCNPPKGNSSSGVSPKKESTISNLSSSSSSSSSRYRSSSSGGGQCMATTKKGTRCKRKAKPGSNYCWQHG